MTAPSHGQHPVLAHGKLGLLFVRANVADARAVTSFLLQQDVRPAPRETDVEAFLGQSDAVTFYAVHNARIISVASCVKDGSTYRVIHFLVAAEPAAVADQLFFLIVHAARDAGTSVLAAQMPRGSRADRLLRAYGCIVDGEESEVVEGRVVQLVDLIYILN